jgi:crotonobetainyl-CoA:carnitine CoA-transferase CaiB-like acyl-CoA transferase
LNEVPSSSDRPRLAQAYILRTRDEQLIAIHLSSIEKFWQGLTAALDSERLIKDERFSTRQGRITHYEALGAELDALFSRHPLPHWVAALASNDVPFAPIHRIDQVVEDPQVRHLGLIVPVAAANGGRHAVRPPVQFDGMKFEQVTSAPLLNQHGAAIRKALASSEGWPDASASESGRGD